MAPKKTHPKNGSPPKANKAMMQTPNTDLVVESHQVDVTETASPTFYPSVTTSNIDSTGKGVHQIDATEKVTPIFATANIDLKLDSGLYVLRALGGGRYEVANIEQLSRDKLSSEEGQAELKSVPVRGDCLSFYESEWEEIQENSALAARISSNDIFPLQKLPIELRKNIYDLVLTFKNPITKLVHPRGLNHRIRSHHIPLPLGILYVCRQLYEECRSSFWLNNFFRHANYSLNWLTSHTNYTQNVRHLSFTWRGLVRDKDSFFDMRSFSQLKVLDIYLEGRYFENVMRATDMEDAEGQKHRNKLYQNHECEAVRRFSKAYGFDNLVQIHGLQRVNLAISDYFSKEENFDEVFDGFEAFLRRTLTLPKDPSKKAVKARLRRKPRRPRNPPPSPFTYSTGDDYYDEMDVFPIDGLWNPQQSMNGL